MRFEILADLDNDDVSQIADAIVAVDPDAKVATDVQAHRVDVDSWLYAEEFLIAFYEAGYDARIKQR